MSDIAFRIERDGEPLLATWCDGLIARQVRDGDDRGGFRCPALDRVPGRCIDSVYPMMLLYRRTGDERYRRAAHAAFDWAERRVSQADGSWFNEVEVPWKGITAFTTISLGEALRHHGDLLATADRERWLARLRRGAEWLLDEMTFETGHINYPLSTAASLAVAAVALGDDKYVPRAREFAHFALRHLTANGLLWGEGERGPDDASPRGLRPIDVSYNVEETLPNLALYASLTRDAEIEAFVVAGLRAHLPLLTPDGAWDAGWSSRQYKWCYWGSATCDGAAAGYQPLRRHDPCFAEAAARNLGLLRSQTHDGLVHAGTGLHARGLPPLLHHTFVRAKGLAVTLESGVDDSPAHELPADVADGVREWPEAGVVRFARRAWRGTITVNDIRQIAKAGGQPSGGALAMLWHARVGPLCVASMNDFVRYEGLNMQTPASEADAFCLTPRIELRVGDRVYSNVYDRAARYECCDADDAIEIRVAGTLRDRDERPLVAGEFELAYRLADEVFVIAARVGVAGATLIVPIVSSAGERLTRSPDTAVAIEKPDAVVQVVAANGALAADATRVFNHVPGMQAIAVHVALSPGVRASLSIAIGAR